MQMAISLHGPIFAESFISSMPGPVFLGFYAALIAGISIFSWVFLRSTDPSKSMESPRIPEDPNPYEIAYLRGGENEVLRLIILELIQRGYLVAREDTIEVCAKAPSRSFLEPLQSAVYDQTKRGVKAKDLFESGLPALVKEHCQSFDTQFNAENLINTPDRLYLRWMVGLPAVLVVLVVGIYKFSVAISKGRHNVGFLFVMGFIGCIVVGKVAYNAVPRASARGRKYLESLRTAFDKLKPGEGNYVTASSIDPNLLLLAGVFGIGILEKTAYASYQSVFKRASSNAGGGCSGCGSSCGSSSSCGGGGGCGGGGCGGCGG